MQTKRCPVCAGIHRKSRVDRANKEYYRDNKESEKARSAADRKANPERTKAARKAWIEANPDRFAQMQRDWKEENKEHRAEYRRNQYQKTKERENALAREWKKNNPEAAFGLNMKRAAAKLQAIPFWVDFNKIKSIYVEAKRITADTGIPHNVDHIMPLQSKFVCGLHIETNLRVITKSENHSKKNKFLPDLAADAIRQIILKAKAFVASIEEDQSWPL